VSSRFSSLRPGPRLAKRLARVELGSLSDEAVLDYLRAEVRQLASQQARVWAAMAEVHRRAPGAYARDADWTPERAFDFAAYEIVSELRVSKPYATHELGYALDLEAMPTVAAALRSGRIDRNRVLVLLDVCAGLTDAHRDQLIDRLLPTAGTVLPSKLRADAQRLAIALDPAWAEKRYREAVRERRLVCFIGEDGTVTLAGENLPADQALAAMAHVSALAKAAQRAGAAAPRSALRAELFTGLLSTRFLGLDQLQIIAELVQQFPKPTAAKPAAAEPVNDEPVEDEPIEDVPASDEPVEDEPVEDEPADEPPSDEPPSDEQPLDEEYYEAELLAQELLDQGFFDDEGDGRQYGELVEIALAMNRSYSRRERTDQDPDPPPF